MAYRGVDLSGVSGGNECCEKSELGVGEHDVGLRSLESRSRTVVMIESEL